MNNNETEIEKMRKEVRELTRAFDDLSMQIRVDTPWIRIKSHVRYGLHALREIPVFSRLLVLVAILLNTVPLIFKIPDEIRKKMAMISLDLIVTAIVIL